MSSARLMVAGLLAPSLIAQELLWQIPSPPSADVLWEVAPFADYDGDGYRDFLQLRQVNYGLPSWIMAMQITSGRDAAVLWEHSSRWHASMAHAGDVDGDGYPDVAIIQGYSWTNVRDLHMWSPATGTLLWARDGIGDLYGYSMVGDLDVDGDGRSEFVTMNMGSTSAAYVYNSNGTLRYSIPAQGYGGVVVSVGKLPDVDSDGHDDILVGINDVSSRGRVLVVSGFSGAILRQHQGQLVGDKTCDFVRSVGDLDGDGVADYAAFPWLTASRAIVPVWSGATGSVIRTWDEFANSVITGEDFDRDGVPDVAIGADWVVAANVNGRTRAYSGRDGAELWRVENAPFLPWNQGSNGSQGWMEYSAGLGVQPGAAYPSIAWLDANWIMVGTLAGRIRAFRTNFVGQGTVRGYACSSTSDVPLIGVRRQPTAPEGQHPARITVAHGPAGAAAFLAIGFASQTSYAGVPLPIPLDPLGLSGCALQVAPITTRSTALGTSGLDAGYGFVDLPHAFTAAVTGTRVAAQWVLLDPASLRFGVSQVHELSLQ